MPRSRRRLLIALLVVPLVSAPCWLFLDGRSRQAARLEAKFAELDAAEPGWRMAELHGARNARLPPDEANAAAQALAAVALGRMPNPASCLDLRPMSELAPEFDKPGNAPPSPALVAKAEARLAEYAEALAVARRVRDLPAGGLPRTDFEPSAFGSNYLKQQFVESAATLLELDAAALAYRGKSAEALSSCRGVLNLARGGVGDEPGVLSQWNRVRITTWAIRAAERTPARNADCPPELLDELQALFAQERAFPRLALARCGEMARTIRFIEQVEEGTASFQGYNGLGLLTLPDGAPTWYVRQNATEAKLAALEFFDQLATAHRSPDPARLAAVGRLDSEWPMPTGPITPRRVAAMLAAGGFLHLNEIESALRARLGCAEAAIACERFRIASGRFPDSLAELPPGLLALVPPDPYTGRPLMLRRDGTGLTVYSTGPDEIDDGGGTLSERGGTGTDIGFRVWEPKLR